MFAHTAIMAKSFSFIRVWNLFKLLCSYYLSRATKKTYVWAKPFSISIEPTTSCNLRCPQCPSGLRSFERETGMLSVATNTRIIDQLHPQLTYITYYFQGEPYLNPDFLDMVSYANKKGIYTCTSTNAHYLTRENCDRTIKSGLSKLIISIDGTTQETYAKYRVGGLLDKVIEGTKNMLIAKRAANVSNPWVIWQFIVFSHNEHQLDDIKKLALDCGVDELQIKTAQIYDFMNGSELMPENKDYSRYVLNGPTFKIKNKLLDHCWRMWQGCVFTWNGDVVPCCFDKDAKHKMGNIFNQDFNEIWQGPAYNGFRSQLSHNRKNIDICTNCSEGTSIWK
ncbi:MAG: radical SAM protein [Bacteroidia bacterium]|jgi:radical SAM protein with 4Fe4S-binding SPASM domain|nr:radical SAM protein [Bacteroidia bacterium]